MCAKMFTIELTTAIVRLIDEQWDSEIDGVAVDLGISRPNITGLCLRQR